MDEQKLMTQAKRGKKSHAKYYNDFFVLNQKSVESRDIAAGAIHSNISSNITTSGNSTLTYAPRDDNLHSNSKLNHYTISNPKVDVLLIGMSYNRDIVKRYESDDRFVTFQIV